MFFPPREPVPSSARIGPVVVSELSVRVPLTISMRPSFIIRQNARNAKYYLLTQYGTVGACSLIQPLVLLSTSKPWYYLLWTSIQIFQMLSLQAVVVLGRPVGCSREQSNVGFQAFFRKLSGVVLDEVEESMGKRGSIARKLGGAMR